MTTFKFTDITGSSHYCECCGGYSASGKEIYVDDKLSWEQYFDGHLGGHQTESPLVDCVLKDWYETKLQQIHYQYSEQGKKEFNRNYPQNCITIDPQLWLERKERELKFHEEDYLQLKEDTKNLPYDELLQIKMIALWIESATGEKVQLQENSRYEDDGSDYEAEYDYYSNED